MSFYEELDPLSLDELKVAFQRPRPRGKNLWYEEIAFKIRQQGDLEFLLQQFKQENSLEQREGLLCGLGASPPSGNAEAIYILTRSLQDKDRRILATAIDGLARQKEKSVLETVLKLQKHRSVYVKGAVLRYLSALFPEIAFPLLVKALKHSHYIVRENAVDELCEMCVFRMPEIQAEALDLIRPFVKDSHPHVRQAAQTAVEWLESG